MEKQIILAVNPGSTSTKIALYEDHKALFVKNLKHSAEELAKFSRIADQFEFRKHLIVAALQEEGVDIQKIRAIVGRGGLVKPISSGVYEVNEALKRDLITPPMGEHASNLGGLIAEDLARTIPGARAFIADPVVVDELASVARVTGLPELPRISIFHALNQKAVARIYADKIGKNPDELNLIVAHLGGGVSVGAHNQGRVIDVNNALDGDGPFSPERAGSLPAGQLAELCFSGKYTKAEVKKMITGRGGLMAHFGTNDAKSVSDRARAGEKHCQEIEQAMSYNIGKSIGAMAAVLKGKVDAILITGGMAYDKEICAYLKEMVGFIAPVEIFPGEDEMGALASNGLLVLSGKVTPKIYK